MISPVERQSAQDRALVDEVIRGILGSWEPYHRKWMQRANHFYALYRNYQDFKKAYRSTTTPRGQDRIWSDGQDEFGPEMFIPLSFSTVETILPAMLSQNPEMAVLPRTIASEANTFNMKALLESQQDEIDYPLRLQTIGKDGLITGLGVQKTLWRTDYRVKPVLAPHPITGMMVPVQQLECLFDDPDADAVDPFDFIVDPFCARIDQADGAFHRTWRSTRYVKRMVDTKQWQNLDDMPFEDLKGLADSSKYSEVWDQRRMIGDRGTAGSVGGIGRDDIHEVLEFHDGDRIVTILNRQIVVASGLNPNWHGELPFQVFRPTELAHELHGIGEIEPIEQLQEEMNVLRTQRRYNADLVLQRVFAYHEGQVEREDIKFGPGYAIPVNGDPRELLFPIQVGDIPNSGYQEEDRIGNDIDRTTGISDTIAGGGMESGGTATGFQLVQSAASRRIESKTRRMEREIVGPGAKQFVSLNQQKILANRVIRVPSLPTPNQPDRRWAWFQMGPAELAGEFEVRPVDNSMQPENIPQNRADAQMLMTLFGQSPGLDQHKLLEAALTKMGIDQPSSLLAPPNATVPAEVLDRMSERLAQIGVPNGQQMIAESLAQAGGPDLLGGAQPPPGGAGGNEAAAAGPGAEPPGEGGPPLSQPQLPAGPPPREPAPSSS